MGSPLHRGLLTRRVLSASRRQSRYDDTMVTKTHHNDSATATKSKRHSASKMSSARSYCRCFGRPSVCSICLTRFVLTTYHKTSNKCPRRLLEHRLRSPRLDPEAKVKASGKERETGRARFFLERARKIASCSDRNFE